MIKRGYKEKQANTVSENLEKIDKKLNDALEKWLSDNIETDYEVEGYTILGLMRKFDMTYPAAILTIDWIIKDPKTAISCIKKGIR